MSINVGNITMLRLCSTCSVSLRVYCTHTWTTARLTICIWVDSLLVCHYSGCCIVDLQQVERELHEYWQLQKPAGGDQHISLHAKSPSGETEASRCVMTNTQVTCVFSTLHSETLKQPIQNKFFLICIFHILWQFSGMLSHLVTFQITHTDKRKETTDALDKIMFL